ncbi:2-dehydropantoate 2-reductase [Sphingobium sp. BHU LFT2]|uniref:2-dehydropantoate 2-reductase n=1 Tax=Sphingobium sp. BHU LFT2 TaxID=2807634 RepID=UPI001BE7C728|nr:2-dehydropantoate 2-reductase [Sphingobium sp. BHU LFT2]MBT2246294.1 2-dehydropantoate 2-reductase [Sphingobium sp. BHU LFT2]
MKTVAIVGTGAIGSTIAAWLIDSDKTDVTLCARTPFDHLSVQTPDQLLESDPRVVTDPSDATPVDWVVIATKTYDAIGASVWLERLVRKDTRVAILQNGVEHMVRFPQLAREQLLPAIVDIPAERHSPGNVVQRRNGSILVPEGAAGLAFVDLFAHSPIEVATSTDWTSAAWKKLAINCAGAVNALTLKPAAISADEEIAELMRGLVRECILVGRAEGAQLSDTLVEEVVAGYRSSPADSINSIHADRLSGRPTEADARNGVIARLAEKHGLEAPFNKMADVILRKS